MKKLTILIILFFLFSLISFVPAQDEPTTPVGDEDIEKIQRAVDYIPLDPETGGVDEEKLQLGKSKAEERIDAINAWLDENASWLRLVFGMVPEISWLFGINLYFVSLA